MSGVGAAGAVFDQSARPVIEVSEWDSQTVGRPEGLNGPVGSVH